MLSYLSASTPSPSGLAPVYKSSLRQVSTDTDTDAQRCPTFVPHRDRQALATVGIAVRPSINNLLYRQRRDAEITYAWCRLGRRHDALVPLLAQLGVVEIAADKHHLWM